MSDENIKSDISEEKLRAAMEKLACHIKPPAQVIKEEQAAGSSGSGDPASGDPSGGASGSVTPGSGIAAGGASCGIGSGAQTEPWKGPDGRILLTQMTTAGG